MQHLVDERGLGDQIEVDSAGIGSWHVGEPADRRSQAAARRRGIELTSIARQIQRGDLDDFDLILAADNSHFRDLKRLAGDDAERAQKVRLLREFDAASVASGDLEVPDPYYGGSDGFEHVLDICEAACRGLLDELER